MTDLNSMKDMLARAHLKFEERTGKDMSNLKTYQHNPDYTWVIVNRFGREVLFLFDEHGKLFEIG
jgi:hypothetical protein